MKVFLLRNPSTMEDEGRYYYMGHYKSIEEAEERRNQAVKDANGWYGWGSFTIAIEAA